MKKFTLLVATTLLLVGCGGPNKEYKEQLEESEEQLEKAKEDTKRLEEISENLNNTTDLIEEVQEEMEIENEIEIEDVSLSENEVVDLLENEALGEGDELTSLSIENGEIKVTVNIADDDIFNDKSLLAETIYSRAGEVLLKHDGWDVFTMVFSDVGTVSMNVYEKETNELDMDYFPIENIIEQLD